MQTVEHAVIAAAGLGSRLGMGKPKCLVEILGMPLIAHQLQLLANIRDVRVVVGFEENSVIDVVRQLRSDVTFVRNPSFRTTTTLHSYALGARHLTAPCLFMDADILFGGESFRSFLSTCRQNVPLLGVTKVKTADCVYAHMNGKGMVDKFSRLEPSPFEWANLAWLPPQYCETGSGAVFERLSEDLPIACHEIISYEFDTVMDLALAREAALHLK